MLSQATRAVLDELTELLAEDSAAPISAELIEELRRRWLKDRPADTAGLESLLDTLQNRFDSGARPSALDDGALLGYRLARARPAARAPSDVARLQPKPSGAQRAEGAAPPKQLGWNYPVYFATNRSAQHRNGGFVGFTSRRSDIVTRGRCQVWVPRNRGFGTLGTPWWQRWARLQFEDDKIRLLATDVLDSEQNRAMLRETMAVEQGTKHGLIFLHGYCTSFEDAALRAAQLGSDLEVPGATAFFSWPSQGRFAGYPADGAAIEASEQAISEFLGMFAEESGADVVHIVAHSMGNRGLLRAFQRLLLQQSRARFGQVFLASPDVDRKLFLDSSQIYQRLSTRTTLYVSPVDRAVQTSRWLHGADRVGFVPPITVVPNIDTISVPDVDSDALGHSSFAGQALLRDIFDLLRHDTSPSERQRLVQQGGYHEFLR